MSSVTSLPPLGKSDHIMIEFVNWCYCTIDHESRGVSKYLYNRGDHMSMATELMNTDWEVLFEGLDTENMWQLFTLGKYFTAFICFIQVSFTT